MGSSNAKPLVFLATCLGFAEATLGTLAGLTDANATIVAVFAMVSLALVVMYWRDPAFLTFTGQQAFDLRIIQEIVDKLPPERVQSYLRTLTIQDIVQGQRTRIVGALETTEEEAESFQREFELLSDIPPAGK